MENDPAKKIIDILKRDAAVRGVSVKELLEQTHLIEPSNKATLARIDEMRKKSELRNRAFSNIPIAFPHPPSRLCFDLEPNVSKNTTRWQRIKQMMFQTTFCIMAKCHKGLSKLYRELK